MQFSQGIAVAILAFASVASIAKALPFDDHHFHYASGDEDSKKRDLGIRKISGTKTVPTAYERSLATPRSVEDDDHEGYRRDPNALNRPPKARGAEPALATPRSVSLEDLVCGEAKGYEAQNHNCKKSFGWEEVARKRDAEAAAMLPPHFQPPEPARPRRREPSGKGRGRGR